MPTATHRGKVRIDARLKKGDVEFTTPIDGELVAPGLAITPALTPDAGIAPNRWSLTHVPSGLRLTAKRLCRVHLDECIPVALGLDVDWARSEDEVRADPNARAADSAIRDLGHDFSCDADCDAEAKTEASGPGGATLWAVHIQGSDEYIAAESREAADEIKAQLDHFDQVNTRRLNFPKASAVVVEWPWDAKAHAAAVEAEEIYPGKAGAS